MIASIDGLTFSRMVLFGAALLDQNKKGIDALNVFPVPDGDTGTNMSMTLSSAVKEIKKIEDESISVVAEALSHGTLKGARGNSGVILSQLLRGFAKALKNESAMEAVLFSKALKEGVESAYKAVMKPKEGTILTIARAVSDCVENIIEENPSESFEGLFQKLLKTGEETLEKTPDMLPVLKEAGVVDAGGKGLLLLYRGFYMALAGDSSLSMEDMLSMEIEEEVEQVFGGENDLENITFTYCTELFVQNMNESADDTALEAFRTFLESAGDSIVMVGDSELLKVHVHTNNPGDVLQRALSLGEIDGVKIENMLEQHRELVRERKAKEKAFGMIAVSLGEGLKKVFQELGVDTVVGGGQTMNPSTEELLNAIERTAAKEVFVLPNNKNIILAARQAAQISEKKVYVIPTKSIPQGISAALSFHPEMSGEENEMRMSNAMSKVRSGSVTYAVRDSSYEGFEVAEGDIIGLNDGKMLEKGSGVANVAKQLISRMISAGGDLVTLFYGADVKEQDAETLKEDMETAYPDIEFLLHNGGQPLYYYLFSVE